MRRKIYGRVMAAVLAAACADSRMRQRHAGNPGKRHGSTTGNGQEESAGSKEFSYFARYGARIRKPARFLTN